MIIAGLQKTTLVDFPGKVAATVFTRGCSFRCHFCHNPELVIPEQFLEQILEKDIFDFLMTRLGKLQGVCITGGEPLLHPDADKFISHIKALGFAVKLDTNGSFPDRLEKIIKDGDVDYIAMDIKSPLNKYLMVTNFQNPKSKLQINSKIQISNNKKDRHSRLDRESTNSHCPKGGPSGRESSTNKSSNDLTDKITKSIDLIMNSGIDYEFRTTVCHPLHKVFDFEGIGKMIKGAKRYYIQNFVQSKHINLEYSFKPFSDKELKDGLKTISGYVNSVYIR